VSELKAGRKEMEKDKGKRKLQESSKQKEQRKNHNQVEAYILDSRISKNCGWLNTTDLLMCPQHLYLGSSTPTNMYPMYVWRKREKSHRQPKEKTPFQESFVWVNTGSSVAMTISYTSPRNSSYNYKWGFTVTLTTCKTLSPPPEQTLTIQQPSTHIK
jgi:hypothetical protein